MLHCPREIMRTITYLRIFLATGLDACHKSYAGFGARRSHRRLAGAGRRRRHPCRGMQRQHVGRGGLGKSPGGHDKNNPDVSKQNRPTLGMPILLDMKKTPGVDQWEGQVYNAKDGQTYSSKIKPTGPDQLEIQGCVLGFLCGGETWTRVAGPFPQARRTAWPRARRRPRARCPKPVQPRRKPNARATGSNAKMAAHAATAGHPADPVGDICLLPDIARFAH